MPREVIKIETIDWLLRKIPYFLLIKLKEAETKGEIMYPTILAKDFCNLTHAFHILDVFHEYGLIRDDGKIGRERQYKLTDQGNKIADEFIGLIDSFKNCGTSR